MGEDAKHLDGSVTRGGSEASSTKCHDGMGDCEGKMDEEDPRLGLSAHPISGQKTTTGNGCHLLGPVLRPVQEMSPQCVTICHPRGETEAQRSRIT